MRGERERKNEGDIHDHQEKYLKRGLKLGAPLMHSAKHAKFVIP